MSRYFLLFLTILVISSCQRPTDNVPLSLLTVRQNASAVDSIERNIFASANIETAEGLEIRLWATDSLAPDPIALSIDDFGKVYLTRTNRQKNSEFDIRGYEHWMTPSISFQTVEDRRAFLRSTFAPEKSPENTWFPDLNNDGSHDWRDLTVEKDEVWRLEDSDKDGIADVSTRIVEDFNEEITDVAGALLVRRKDMFVGIGPDMWRLEDTDGDNIPDKKESISHGYAVHIGFGAHGMSGVIEGPDGKIYWGIGDIGAHITAKDGQVYSYPNEGVIVRCNPDGSDFEVFAHGLRNTHEFVFDTYGNLISSDNDGDHPGESERLVHVVEGSDAGWRSNWQYGKYTDPKNNGYNVWMDEKLYIPRWDGQAAYIIPPIQNYHNGPTGMVYNPGTALGKDWLNTFFLVEFVGNPSRSPIWAFKLKSSGASFELDEEKIAVKGILPTGLRFGPDGALYAADWVNGWGTKNYGRVWKIDVPGTKEDMQAQRQMTQEYMTLDYEKLALEKLGELLGYEDQRIRLKAQFELANRKEKALHVLAEALTVNNSQLKRIHAIWGIGQISAIDPSQVSVLLPLLDDPDAEIIAQVAKVLGDVKAVYGSDKLITLLGHSHPRVQFFAAQALGRMKYEAAQDALITLLETNQDRDLYIRHAAVLALARIGNPEKIITLKGHPNRSLRLAAVLVLRQMKDGALADFLDDRDEFIVTEAARAIHDDLSVKDALPDLAEKLKSVTSVHEPLVRRILSACQRLGDERYLDLVLAYAQKPDISRQLRAEALAVIGTWSEPSVLDRVDGRYRGSVKRDPAIVQQKVQPLVAGFLKSKDPEVIIAAGGLLKNLNMVDLASDLAAVFRTGTAHVKASLLRDLADLKYEKLGDLIAIGLKDKDEELKSTALGMLDKLDLDSENLLRIADPVIKEGSVRELQQLVQVLGQMPLEKSGGIMESLTNLWEKGTLAREVRLDLLEAIDSSGSQSLKERVKALHSDETPMQQFAEAMYGGSRREGWQIFNQNPTAQCTRCHSLTGEGEHQSTTVGPPLFNIGNELTREQLLQAVIEPSARIAPGYGVVVLTLNDNQVISGILLEEKPNELLIKVKNPEPMRVPVSRIQKRENLPSSMPPVGNILSKRQVRDLVEFLANLKREEG